VRSYAWAAGKSRPKAATATLYGSQLLPEIACNQPELRQDYQWLWNWYLLDLQPEMMKVSEDYKAKTRLWAEHLKVVALPPGPPLPRFASKRFRTHAEMNRWKASLLRQTASQAAGHG